MYTFSLLIALYIPFSSLSRCKIAMSCNFEAFFAFVLVKILLNSIFSFVEFCFKQLKDKYEDVEKKVKQTEELIDNVHAGVLIHFLMWHLN